MSPKRRLSAPTINIEPSGLQLFHANPALRRAVASVDPRMPAFNATVYVIVDCGPGVGPQLGIATRIPSKTGPKSSRTCPTNDGTRTGWLSASSSLPMDLVLPAPHEALATSVLPVQDDCGSSRGPGELRELKIMAYPSVIPDEEGKEMEFRPDTFPKLHTLECKLSLPRMQVKPPEGLSAPATFSSIRSPGEPVYLLGQSCPQLREISLILFLDRGTRAVWFGPPLDVDVLYGLAPFHNLVSLRLAHSFPITLTDDQVRRIGTTWKHLKTLVLCVGPDANRLIKPEMGASILTLAVFAELLSNLSHLGLYFRRNDVVRFSGDLHPQHRFKNLRTLQVGFSPTPRGESEDLAFLLVSLCGLPAPTIDTAQPAWHPVAPRSYDHRFEAWGYVAEIMDGAIGKKSHGTEEERPGFRVNAHLTTRTLNCSEGELRTVSIKDKHLRALSYLFHDRANRIPKEPEPPGHRGKSERGGIARTERLKLLFNAKALLQGGREYDAISSVRNADWERFSYYARRVRTINIQPGGLRLFHVNKALRLVLASIDYPFGPSLLPHVRKVKWVACCPACQVLMLRATSSSTVDLELDLKSVSLIGSLRELAPDLRELALRMTEPTPVGSLEDPLSRWISSLRHLTTLWLPPYYLSKTIVAAAGELKELRELKIIADPSVRPDEEGKEMEFRPDTFPRLRILECNLSLPRAVQLLQPSPRVEALESLYLDCSGHDNQSVSTFTHLLGQSGPELREISLILFLDRRISAESFGQPLEVDVLYDPDADRLITPEMGTSIFTLALFAELLPNLSHLGLYFRNRDVVRFSGNLHPQHQFKNLRTLQRNPPGIRRRPIRMATALIHGDTLER
ncbi:hypothetical protein FRC00_012217 [Tulasnella sp. 408]|nr:hypothetical protein FRC00_012217 [Tulasnella sp. 408]